MEACGDREQCGRRLLVAEVRPSASLYMSTASIKGPKKCLLLSGVEPRESRLLSKEKLPNGVYIYNRCLGKAGQLLSMSDSGSGNKRTLENGGDYGGPENTRPV